MSAFLFPAVATVFAGVAHLLAFRAAFGLSAWIWIGFGYAPLLAYAIWLLRRDEVLSTLLRPVAGDMSIAIMGAAVGIAALWGVALLGIKFAHDFVARDLVGLIRVAVAVPSQGLRAAGLIGYAVVEEIVWRGAVAHALESKVGSRRAPWVASALWVVAILPTLFGISATPSNELGERALLVHPSRHASLVAAAIILGVVTAFTRAKYRRLSVPIVAHAIFSWLSLELMLPNLWTKI